MRDGTASGCAVSRAYNNLNSKNTLKNTTQISRHTTINCCCTINSSMKGEAELGDIMLISKQNKTKQTYSSKTNQDGCIIITGLSYKYISTQKHHPNN